jgi:hypothetical protein
LPQADGTCYLRGVNESRREASEPAAEIRRRVDLAQQAYRSFHARCFWSYREDAVITESKIPFVIRGLREHGGSEGYRLAAELCR